MSDKIYGVKENKALVEVSPKSDVENLENDISKKISKAGDTMTGDLILNGAKHIVRGTSEYLHVMDIVDKSLDNTVDPSGKRVQTFLFYDKNGVKTGAMEHIKYSDGGNAMQFNACDKAGHWMGQPFLVYKSTVAERVFAPTPSGRAENSRIIPTTEWVNSASTVVHTTGNETIAGMKIFSNHIIIKQATAGQHGYRIVSVITDRDTAPTSNLSADLVRFEDAKGLPITGYSIDDQTNGSKESAFYLRHLKTNVRMGLHSDGTNIWGFCPTPFPSATGNQIATASWVNSKLSAVNRNVAGKVSKSGDTINGDLNVNGTLSVNGMPVSSGIAELYNMAPQLRYGDNVFAVLVNDYPDAFFGKTLIFKLAFGTGGTYKTSVDFVQCHTIDEFGTSNANPKYTFEPITDNYLAIYCKRESRADTAGQTHDVLVFNLMAGSTSTMLNDMTFSVYVKD